MEDRIEKYLAKLESELLSSEKRLIEMSLEWTKSFPSAAGVYIVREEGEICYIGETGNIQKRMRNLLETRNHTLRRKIGSLKFSTREGFEKATPSRKFQQIFEDDLNRIFEDNFEVSAIAVAIGRKELEERLIEKFKPIYNTIEKRKSDEKETTYSNADIRINQPNAYRAWSEEEDNDLCRLEKEGKSIKELSLILGRKCGAITSRIKKIKERKELLINKITVAERTNNKLLTSKPVDQTLLFTFELTEEEQKKLQYHNTLKLQIEIVPKSCWFSNVRKNVNNEQWDKIRKRVYAKSSFVCDICGEKGIEHPVECHEVWIYDDAKLTQCLSHFQSLCPSCHEVKHIGLAELKGNGERAFNRFKIINRIDDILARQIKSAIFKQWKIRSTQEWVLDIELLSQYGLNPNELKESNKNESH